MQMCHRPQTQILKFPIYLLPGVEVFCMNAFVHIVLLSVVRQMKFDKNPEVYYTSSLCLLEEMSNLNQVLLAFLVLSMPEAHNCPKQNAPNKSQYTLPYTLLPNQHKSNRFP